MTISDGRALGGTHIRVSFCAPGPPGRSMLAALIAAQTMALNRGKGLLPDPTALQILSGLNNPAALKMLLAPLTQGRHSVSTGLLGPTPAVPLLANPALSAALLQVLLQSQAHIQQVPPVGPHLQAFFLVLSALLPPHASPLLCQHALLWNPLLWAQGLHSRENQQSTVVSGFCVDSLVWCDLWCVWGRGGDLLKCRHVL
uniref:Uncharacterized protein n=1 Tax=Scleropages formosus TaxID=113540 RepID=A0A8C9V909_SCLFO